MRRQRVVAVDRARWVAAPVLSLAIVWLLLLLMHRMIRAPDGPAAPEEVVDAVRMVTPAAHRDSSDTPLPTEAPPPPPAMPPSIARSDLPSAAAPALSMTPAPIDIGSLGVPVSLGSGLGIGNAGAFGGVGRGGDAGGAGGAGSGYAHGAGVSGKPAIPLGTARPQMPDWACKKQIKGWIDVVFTVQPNGRVRNVRIVDADPRGVFEANTVESVSHWIYSETPYTWEMEQHIDMDPADCAYNWQ